MSVGEIATPTIKMIKVSKYEERKLSNLVNFEYHPSVLKFWQETNVTTIMKENSLLRNKLKTLTTASEDECLSEVEGLLGELVKLCNTSNRNKYSENIKKLALNLYLIGGKKLYEILSANLPLPSLSTAKHYLYSLQDLDYRNGKLMCNELAKYINQYNLSKVVYGAEDMTKIKETLRYDSKTNEIVGLSAPLSEETGLPIADLFIFDNIERAYELVKTYDTAPYVNVFMIQPLTNKCMPFPVLLFGSNNKFTHLDVTNRWVLIKDLLSSYGIELLGKKCKRNLVLKNIFLIYFQAIPEMGTLKF